MTCVAGILVAKTSFKMFCQSNYTSSPLLVLSPTSTVLHGLGRMPTILFDDSRIGARIVGDNTNNGGETRGLLATIL
jgi:hypothetical protein